MPELFLKLTGTHCPTNDIHALLPPFNFLSSLFFLQGLPGKMGLIGPPGPPGESVSCTPCQLNSRQDCKENNVSCRVQREEREHLAYQEKMEEKYVLLIVFMLFY